MSRSGPRPGAGRALGWSFLNGILGKVAGLAIGILLARLLGPEEFGTYAVAMVALLAILSFNELGVSLAIVRWPGDPRGIAPTVTTLSVVASLLFFAAAFALAPPFAQAMGDPGAVDVVRLLLVCIPVNGLVATPAALLQREFRQGVRTVIDQVNVWLGAGVSIVLAVAGVGAMSLAIGRVAATVVAAVLFLTFSPERLRFGFDRRIAGELLRFGLPLAGTSIIVFGLGYADQLVVGNVLGSTLLGFYVLAANLSSWPVTVFSQPLRSVAPAAFARIQESPEQRAGAFRAAFRLVLAAALPVCAFIAGAASPIVEVVYGQAWATAADALRWLALFAVVRIVFELGYDFLVVLRRSASILALQIVWVAALLPSLILGTLGAGITGAALAQLLVGAVVVLPTVLAMVARTGVAPRLLLVGAVIPLLGGAVAYAASAAASALLAPPLLAGLVAGGASLAVLAVVLLLERRSVLELRRHWAARAEVAAEVAS